MLRLSGKEEFVEDLYLSIRELIEHHGCQPREIRRFVNQA
jgi:plasmid maintenance system antidote protein VapI